MWKLKISSLYSKLDIEVVKYKGVHSFVLVYAIEVVWVTPLCQTTAKLFSISGFVPITTSPLHLKNPSQNSQGVFLQVIQLSPLEPMLPSEENLFYKWTTEYISVLLLFRKVTVYHFQDIQNVTANATTQDGCLQVDHAECMPLFGLAFRSSTDFVLIMYLNQWHTL